MTNAHNELWSATRTELRAYSIGTLIAGVGFGLALAGRYQLIAVAMLALGVVMHGWGMRRIYARNR